MCQEMGVATRLSNHYHGLISNSPHLPSLHSIECSLRALFYKDKDPVFTGYYTFFYQIFLTLPFWSCFIGRLW